MKALVISEPGQTCLVERSAPQPGPGDVLLRVRRVGLCGSDLNTFRGANPLVSYPRIPGHEIAATIERAGDDVPNQWSAGRDVLVIPYTNCGTCSACRQSRFNCCRANQTLGVQRDGGMAEWLVVPWQKLIAAESLSLRELALVEPLTIGFHAVARGRVESRDTVAVLGCGAVGLGAIAGAARRGARVIAVDIDPHKLEVAALCGATVGIDSGSDSLPDRLHELTDGHGPDVVIEAVGRPETFRAAVEHVSFAGRVVYIGYAKTPVEYETRLFVMKELDILGSRNALPHDFAEVIAHLEEKRFPVDHVITHSVALTAAGASLAAWNRQPEQFVKILVDFDAP
jgi:2-desacetyl-2-hydroxyethyl bacteriochlorophyllide A dehydrogenase